MKLFPRLPRTFAEDAFAKQASLAPQELVQIAGTTHPLQIWPATGAPRITGEELAGTRSDLVATAERFGWPSPLAREEQRDLDLALARVLWERVELTPAEASFGDVWSFLALVVVPDVVWWRAAGSTNIERFVATDLTRHTLARLWWRAHLFTWDLEDSEDGWELWRASMIGEADLDQIQTRRSGYGRSPRVFRGLVRAYSVALARAGQIGVDRRVFWRQAYLRWVLRLGAFSDFSGLTQAELDDDLAQLALEIEPASDGTDPLRAVESVERSNELVEPRDFDALLLQEVVVHISEAVRAKGQVRESELCTFFEAATGIPVPPSRRDIVRGIAWQGAALQYLSEKNDQGVRHWSPGNVLPAPDGRWGKWSVQSFKEHVGESNGDPDVEQLADVLFAGHAGKTVRRVVRLAINETRSSH